MPSDGLERNELTVTPVFTTPIVNTGELKIAWETGEIGRGGEVRG